MKNKKHPRRSYELKSLPPTKKGHRLVSFSLKTNPNFNTNAPPFEVRGCKVILGGAFDIFLSDFDCPRFAFFKIAIKTITSIPRTNLECKIR